MKNKEFSEWIKEKWLEAGGLISKSAAADILKLHKTRIGQMTKENKIKEYKYNNHRRFVSFKEILEELNKRKKDNQPQ